MLLACKLLSREFARREPCRAHKCSAFKGAGKGIPDHNSSSEGNYVFLFLVAYYAATWGRTGYADWAPACWWLDAAFGWCPPARPSGAKTEARDCSKAPLRRELAASGSGVVGIPGELIRFKLS